MAVSQQDIEDWLVVFSKRADELLGTIYRCPSPGADQTYRASLDAHRRNRARDSINDAVAILRAEAILAIDRHRRGDIGVPPKTDSE